MSRKSKLTSETTKRFCKSIEQGLTYKDSCHAAGISTSTFYVWKAKAADAKSGKYVAFMDALKKAEVRAKFNLLQIIDDCALGGKTLTKTKIKKDKEGNILSKTVTITETAPIWQASAWLLERRFPDEFGRNREVNTDDNVPLPWSDDSPDPLGAF